MADVEKRRTEEVLKLFKDMPGDTYAEVVVAVNSDGTAIGAGGGGGGAATIADGADVAQGTTTDDTTFNTVIGRLKKLISLLPTSLGAKTSANSLSVTLATDQTVEVANDAGNPLPVSGTVTATGPLTDTQLRATGVATTMVDGGSVALGALADASTANTVIGRLKKIIALIPTALGANGGFQVEGVAGGVAQPVDNTKVGGTAIDTNSGVKSGGTQRFVLATDQPALTTPMPVSGTVTITDGSGPVTIDGTVTADTELTAVAALADATANPTITNIAALAMLYNGATWDRTRGDTANGLDVDVTRLPNSTTGSQSSVSSSASNVTVLASNSSRKGATVYNDSTAILYLKMGATASSSSHATQLAAGGYYEVPFGYSGIIDGIWASANGSARVCELT